ncbi:hypothetical protein BD289DRAFT_358937 [Coniella lustricola]|uniref:Ubiquitin carboxyl-terminal hydrolase n=1 Tax=Coniella lustricola TaxID=2025994 RepID=A0A2T3AMC9_9PEZI|nr:hypothetical protein BD289DRAFT_358937 [Coniella lustricola]
MPEKPLTVAAYAAGASLAAATLIYVFAPTYFLDGEPTGPAGSSSSRKKGVVGLVNPANDCFINSILQALAGLGDLRVYLIREMHRRSVGDQTIYTITVPEDWVESNNRDKKDSARVAAPVKKHLVAGQQKGLVTQGLKDMLDQLNERPIYKKTISAAPFVTVLEDAFRQNISRQQHDAQEFLQIVVERLCDEYHAGHRARKYALWKADQDRVQHDEEEASHAAKDTSHELGHNTTNSARGPPAVAATGFIVSLPDDEEEDGFPLEGITESQIECLTCGFKPRPSRSRFCTLTLSVPHDASSTTLNACFDAMFKIEHIDDYKCDKCRIVHARQLFTAELAKSTEQEAKTRLQDWLDRLQHALEADPEKLPEDIVLPDSKLAPSRRIARHTRVTRFPKILAIHLSRSIYAGQALKNSAKVAFPERLPLGGLLLRRNYKLLGVVAHKGGHQSGHYESFRRQNVYPPYSNPTTFQPFGIYSKTASPQSTPQLPPVAQPSSADGTPRSATPDSSRDKLSPNNKDKDTDSDSIRSIAASARSVISKISPSRRGSNSGGSSPSKDKDVTKIKPPKKRKVQDKWWRISDDRIKEASTRELLGMQREVYLLFYEMERDGS